MSESVLVVDDEQEISSAIRSILEDEGYAVFVCADGKEAVDLLRAGHQPDLVISDIMMPQLSGLELVEHIRGVSACREVPVILMSGINPSKTRSAAKWNDFLKKPFNLDELLEAVIKQLPPPARSPK